MRLFIDGNIILDVLQSRTPYVNDSALIWKICETNQAEGYVSSLTFANLVYVMRNELSSETIEKVLQKLMIVFHFTDLTGEDLKKAASLRWNDFEDAVQSVTAGRIHADYIITRNIRDFSQSKTPVLTPLEFLQRFWNVP